MKSSGMRRFLHIASLASLSILVASSVFKPETLSAQELPKGPNQAKPIDPNAPNVVSPTSQETGILSLQGGTKLMQEANSAVSSQNYPLALKKFQEARQVFNQLSNFYQELAGSFSGIDNRIADGHRRKALETAEMRDNSTYQLALVHRAQNQSELAVPLLVQIIRSQQPTRDLGKKAYQQLFELGFVDSPFPRPRADSAAPAPTSAKPLQNK